MVKFCTYCIAILLTSIATGSSLVVGIISAGKPHDWLFLKFIASVLSTIKKWDERTHINAMYCMQFFCCAKITKQATEMASTCSNAITLCPVLPLIPSNCRIRTLPFYAQLGGSETNFALLENLCQPVRNGALHSKVCTMGRIRENLMGSTHLLRSKDNNAWQAQRHVWAWWQGVCGQRNKV